MTPEQLAKSGTEHSQQRAVFAWANMAARYGLQASRQDLSYTKKGYADNQLLAYNDAIPELRWLHAIHNQGHGDAIRGSRAKAEGVKAGILDIHLPFPSRFEAWHSLYIEMKVDNNKPTEDQLEFMAYCHRHNIKCVVCYNWQDARDEILKYLGLV